MTLPKHVCYYLDRLYAEQKNIRNAKTWSEDIEITLKIKKILKEIQREVCCRRLHAAKSQLKQCDHLVDWIGRNIDTCEHYARVQRERSKSDEKFIAEFSCVVDEDYLQNGLLEIW